jgi:hypothetical protein
MWHRRTSQADPIPTDGTSFCAQWNPPDGFLSGLASSVRSRKSDQDWGSAATFDRKRSSLDFYEFKWKYIDDLKYPGTENRTPVGAVPAGRPIGGLQFFEAHPTEVAQRSH